jgi:hypothetical protein
MRTGRRSSKTKKAIPAFVFAAESNIWEMSVKSSEADLSIYLERKGRCLEAHPSI